MDLLQQKHSLFIKLGTLFGPLQRVIEYPEQYNEQERAQAIARFCHEYPLLANDFRTFSSEGQSGHDYIIQFSRFYNALHEIQIGLQYEKNLEELVPPAFLKAQAAINTIPIPQTSVILEVGSPFTTYCQLRSLCETDATTSLLWIDAYVSASIFHRYLSGVRSQVHVTLVTCKPSTPSRGDKKRWNEFLDISSLYSEERGPTAYRVVQQNLLHDRSVVFDDNRIYNLGGSAKDAASKNYFTITPVDPSDNNLQVLRARATSGTELFGPATTVHTRDYIV